MPGEYEIPLRITLVEPPAGVMFSLQCGRDEIVDAKRTKQGEELSFDLTIRVKGDPDLGSARFLGPFVQGPTGGKFIYLRVGSMAGDVISPWSRRVKVPLASLNWPNILAAASNPKVVVEARYPATGRDGSPACATVKLLAGGWHQTKK
jgi:hypothetical protein